MINKKYYPLLLGVFILVPIILAYQTFERNLGEEKAEGRPISSKAVKQILEKHPDYKVIKNSDTFHDWVEEQNQQIKNWTYHNPFDAEAAITVLDLFKMDHPNLGCSEGDCINGKGHYFFYDDLYDYKGDFQDGAPHGSGVLTQVLDIGKITAESGTWKDGLPDVTEIWTLRQIELLEENHSWWYSENTITHTDQYTEYLDLDSFAGNSLVTHVQLDCENNNVRPTRMLFFNDVMALGGAVAKAPSDLIPIPDDWLDIPVQPKADLYINICEAKRLALEATKPD